MRIAEIKKHNGIYYVATEPNFIERWMGKTAEVNRYYKSKNEVFGRHPHLGVFYRSDGHLVLPGSKLCVALTNFNI